MPKVSEMLGEDHANYKPNTKWLYTTASLSGWTHQGVKDLIYYNFKKASTKDLDFSEFNQVLGWLETLPPNTVTTGKDENSVDLFDQRPPDSM